MDHEITDISRRGLWAKEVPFVSLRRLSVRPVSTLCKRSNAKYAVSPSYRNSPRPQNKADK